MFYGLVGVLLGVFVVELDLLDLTWLGRGGMLWIDIKPTDGNVAFTP